MTIDLFERYATLDPARESGIQPEWSAMTPVLPRTADWREPNMQTQQQTPTQPKPPGPKRTGLLVAAAALALIVIVGAVALFSSGSDADLPPATTPPTTAAVEATAEATVTPAEGLAVADAFFVAYNTGSTDELVDLFAPDARVTTSYEGSELLEREEMTFVWNSAQGTQLSSGSCTVTQNEPEPVLNVVCRGENRNANMQAVGAPSVPTVFAFVITPDGITKLNYKYGFPVHNQTQVPFQKWMQANNPDDAEKIVFGAWTTLEEAREYGLLTAQYAEKWAAYLKTNGCIFQNECILLQARTPSETIEAYIAAYNAHDIDAVMAFFTDESVVTGHPFSTTSSGTSSIRTLHVTDLSAAAAETAYTISNVEVTGDTVTWDHVWVNNKGEEFCQQGQRAVVKDGTIVSWTWPPGDDFSCP